MAITDIPGQSKNLLSSMWNISEKLLLGAGISTGLAFATGGISLTADAVIAAGQSIALTPTDMFSFTGQGIAHNLHGAADGVQAAVDWALS